MLQLIEQTDEEKEKMYMKCTKKELVKMLIEANKQLANREILVIPYERYYETGTFVSAPLTVTATK